MTPSGPPPVAPATDASPERQLLGPDDVQRMLRRLAHEIVESRSGSDNLVLVGIRTGGDYLAQQLVEIIAEIDGSQPPLGLLDITLYRDDLDERPDQPQVLETRIPFDLSGKDVVLVDDVLFTGRTIRAALNALMDFGRPQQVRLAVLIDRGHRELPIRPDLVGKNLPTEKTDRVEVAFADDHQATGVFLCPGHPE